MTPQDKLPLREKLAYGFGDLASVLYWQTFMLYLTFFYTDVFGISALAAAALLGLSRSLDAFFDPLMGMLGDRTNTRWGKYRPYLLWICVPFAIAGVMTFSTPGTTVASNLEGLFGSFFRNGLGLLVSAFSGLGHFLHRLPLGFISQFLGDASESLSSMAAALQSEISGKLIWAILTYNALMLLYTAINIPYTAMLGVLSPNPDDRTTLSSVKFVFAYAAGMIVSASLLFLARAFGGDTPARGWQLTFVVIGVAAIVFFLIAFFNTRERVQPPKEQKTSMVRDLRDLFTNAPWLILLGTTITMILFVAVRSSVTVHYFKYFVGTQTITLPSWLPKIGGTQEWHLEGLVSTFNTTGQLASLLGVVLIPFVSKWLGGRKLAFTVIFVIAIAATSSFYLLKPDQILAMIVLNIIGSITGGPLSALLWAMYADTADYAEWKKGRRATGLVFSASIFSQKQGWAIGAAVALGLMQSVGFVANTTQTPESLHGLVLLMSVIPAALGVVSVAILFFFYPLNEAKVAEIGAELQARRASAAGEPATAAV